MEANSPGGQGSRRAVAPSGDDDDVLQACQTSACGLHLGASILRSGREIVKIHGRVLIINVEVTTTHIDCLN